MFIGNYDYFQEVTWNANEEFKDMSMLHVKGEFCGAINVARNASLERVVLHHLWRLRKGNRLTVLQYRDTIPVCARVSVCASVAVFSCAREAGLD